MKSFFYYVFCLFGIAYDVQAMYLTKGYNIVLPEPVQEYDDLIKKCREFPKFISREDDFLNPARDILKKALKDRELWAYDRLDKDFKVIFSWGNCSHPTRSKVQENLKWLPMELVPEKIKDELKGTRQNNIYYWVAVYGKGKKVCAASEEKRKEMFDNGGLNQEIAEIGAPVATWYLSLSSENPPKSNEIPDFIKNAPSDRKWFSLDRLSTLCANQVDNREKCQELGNSIYQQLYNENYPQVFEAIVDFHVSGEWISWYDFANQFFRPNVTQVKKLTGDIQRVFPDDAEEQQALFDARVKNVQWWSNLNIYVTNEQYNQALNPKKWSFLKERDRQEDFRIMFEEGGLVKEIQDLLEQEPNNITLLEIKLALSKKGQLIPATRQDIDALVKKVDTIKRRAVVQRFVGKFFSHRTT